MHSNTTPVGVSGERDGAEALGAFRLAGFEGGFRGMVTQQDITMERSDGRGIRIAIESISKVRHQLTASVPRGFAVLSLLALIASIRVLVDPIRTVVIALSSLTLLLWLLARRPVLVIDTSEGDRHRMTADDRVLLKTRILISRIRDGMTLTESMVGLDELLDETGYPTIRPLHEEAVAVAATLLDNDGSDLDAALDRLHAAGGFSEVSGSGLSERRGVLDADVLPRQGLFGDSHRARASRAMESERTEREHIGDGIARGATHTTHSGWPFDDSTDDDPFSSSPFDGHSDERSDAPMSIGGEVGSRSDSGFSMAMDGDLFGFGDSFASESTATQEATSFDDCWEPAPEPTSRLPVPVPPTRPPSSMELIRRARERAEGNLGLPPPTALAVREECLPGLVEAARGPSILDATPLDAMETTNSGESEIDEGPLADYPSLSRFVRTMPRNRRVGARRPSAFGRLAKSVARGVDSMTGRGRTEVDDYSSTYGDGAGGTGRSSQFLWLRADQDHQATVAAGMGALARSSGGRDPRDAMSDIVRSVAIGEREPPMALPPPSESDGPGAFDAMRATKSGADDEGSIPGIRRLG